VNGFLSDSRFQTSLTWLGRPLCWDSLQVSRSRLAFSLWQLHFGIIRFAQRQQFSMRVT